jgi:hypothetical protein
MADSPVRKRTTEESLSVIDRVIGRCLRDRPFAEAVLENPEVALAAYGLQEDEMDDFRALKKNDREEALRGWAEVRMTLPERLRIL